MRSFAVAISDGWGCPWGSCYVPTDVLDQLRVPKSLFGYEWAVIIPWLHFYYMWLGLAFMLPSLLGESVFGALSPPLS